MPPFLNTVPRVVAVLVVCALLVPLVVCSLPLWWEARARNRKRRHRGYIPLSRTAFGNANPTTEPTRTRTATSTESKTRTAATTGPPLLAVARKILWPTDCGDSAASRRGDHTTDARGRP